MQIDRALAKENPAAYLPDVAITLNNLANLHSDKNEFAAALEKYEEALQIRRALAKENPAAYLPDVAMTLNNLAVLHSDKNELAEAEEKYEESLHIYKALAKENHAAFLPYVLMTAINLSIFYLDSVPEKEKSIALAMETIEIAQKFPEHYRVQQYAITALRVLKDNGV